MPDIVGGVEDLLENASLCRDEIGHICQCGIFLTSDDGWRSNRGMQARFAVALLIVSGIFCRPSGTARPVAATFPTDDKTIVHLLNRLGFGPRPGDIERVRQLGVARYVDQQLHPERVPDNGLATRLAGLDTIDLTSRTIAEQYEMPALEARRERQQRMKADAGGADDPPGQPDPQQQRANTVVLELAEQKILRAVYSERQLQEVLTDFWFNHFNVDARKGVDRFLLTEYERETIRPHVLGKFRDLLEATAKSPAMLFYLDNWMSTSGTGPATAARQDLSPRKGLNENYGRELMELHTLGVDGGYTQHDVTEVARAFTGWTIRQPRHGGSFEFRRRLHDDGEKIVLGHRITAGGGMRDGEQVLDILAAHPSTAHFIATKLVRRFVGDAPPPALVDRAAARFRATGGDLRETMRAILLSPELLAPAAVRAKTKTPFEFVVSAVRATGADVTNAAPLVRALRQLGMPLYECQPPTGYSDSADAWVNTGALVNRMNFALQLAGNKVPGAVLPASPPTGGAPATRGGSSSIVAAALNDDVSAATRATIARATTAPQIIALTLGAPEFQRR
jgi:uncharacterized protein (DUF1800 family)